MAIDLLALRRKTRRALHGAFSVEARYADASAPDPVDLRVRWHHRINRFGDLQSQGYAEFIDGIERVIFDVDELREKGVSLRERGVVTLTSEEWGDIALQLHSREPRDGPVQEIWEVKAIGN